MQKKKRQFACTIIILLVLCSLYGCSRDTLPTYAPDVISTAYHAMSKVETYRMHGTVTLIMKSSGRQHTYTIDTTAVSLKDPREITVKMVMIDNGEEEEKFLYYNEDLDDEHSFLYVKENWSKEAKDAIRQYEYAVPFGVYFIEVASFHQLEEKEGMAIYEGKISGEHIVTALKESGVLRKFALTGLSEEKQKGLDSVQVRAWVAHKGCIIKRVEVEMTDAVKKMTALLYQENAVAGPEILSCKYVIDSIELYKGIALPLPDQAEQTLRNTLK